MKALFVATVVKTHINEFHLPYLQMFKDMGWDTSVAAKNDYDTPSECIIPGCDYYYDIKFERNPFNLANVKAYKQLKQLITEEQYDIIHCHTPVGGALTRLAARKARKTGSKVFYTAHGFHFYRGAAPINWALYYPVERFLAHFTDVLITINKEDYERARKFKAGRVEYIPGIGVDIDRFHKPTSDMHRNLKTELGIPEDAKVLLSVGEVNKNKNHKVVIKALPAFENVWYVVCGSGPLIDDLRAIAERLSVSDRVLFTGYRNDVSDFYDMADLFIFPSYREGLPVALMEAMASELVCIAARNRGTNDLLPDSRLRFSAADVDELKCRIKTALSEDCSDEILRNTEKLKDYDLRNVLERVRRLYLDSLQQK